MKNNRIFIIFIAVLFALSTSCKSAKNGCGLTSDAQKIDNLNTYHQQSDYHSK
jgi:hypothetical protein